MNSISTSENSISPNERNYIKSLFDQMYEKKPADDLQKHLFPTDRNTIINEQHWKSLHNVLQANKKNTKTKRYVFIRQTTDHIRKDALEALFDAAFKRNPEEIIACAERTQETRFYSPWKKLVSIDLPYFSNAILSDPVFIGVVKIGSFILTYLSLFWLQEVSNVFLQGILIPLISSQIPEQASLINSYALVIFQFIQQNAIFHFIKDNTLKIFICSFVISNNIKSTSIITKTIRNIAYSIRTISWSIMWGIHSDNRNYLIFANSVDLSTYVPNLVSDIGRMLKNQAELAKEYRIRICKEKAHKIWMDIVNKTEPVVTFVGNEQAV